MRIAAALGMMDMWQVLLQVTSASFPSLAYPRQPVPILCATSYAATKSVKLVD